MNNFVRNRVIKNIHAAIEEAENVNEISHRFLKGRIREIAINNLITPIISKKLEIGTGKIIDSTNYESSEIDLIIHSKELIPPLMFNEQLGLFPIESCLAAIEVKSTVNATELQTSITIAQSLLNDDIVYLSGEIRDDGSGVPHDITKVTTTFFAFKSDLKEGGMDEFERYKQYDVNWKTEPSIQQICVVGKGCWLFATIAQNPGWKFVAPTDDFDEVIAFLRLIADSCVLSFNKRKSPLIGNYLNDLNIFRNV